MKNSPDNVIRINKGEEEERESPWENYKESSDERRSRRPERDRNGGSPGVKPIEDEDNKE